MPKDVHRALESLEEFHADLIRPSDTELKYAIEKVISSFKSNLFTALCDLQEFYDGVLLNEQITFGQKVVAARDFAERWERGHPIRSRSPFLIPTTPYTPIRPSLPRPASSLGRSVLDSSISAPYMDVSKINRLVDEFGREWEVEEVTLDVSEAGLGFSISGGRDREPDPDHYIRITNVTEGGAVARDGRLRVGDVILKVNDIDVVNVDHLYAVNALQRPGALVRLLVKRLKQQPVRSQSQSLLGNGPMLPQPLTPLGQRSRSLHQLPQRPPSHMSMHGSQPIFPTQPLSYTTNAPRIVTLRKGDAGLGFNIVGGEDGEPIYVSHVLPGGVADLSGSVKKGDVLLQVNDINLQGASHLAAASALKSVPPNSYVHLQLQYRPREYHQFEDRIMQAQNTLRP